MPLSCSSVCIKYILFAFNLVFVITGIILISVGATIKAYYGHYESILEDQFFTTPNLLIAIGVIIFFVAFFGCCGAVKENYCMTFTFSCLLILIFILEFSAGISGYVLKNQAYDFLSERLTETLAKYSPVFNNDITYTWDQMQRTFNCCGVHGPEDWNASATLINGTTPLSCCSLPVGASGSFDCNPESPYIHPEGCLDAFSDFIKSHALTIGGVGLGIAFIQLLGIIFSCHLSKQIRLNYENV